MALGEYHTTLYTHLKSGIFKSPILQKMCFGVESHDVPQWHSDIHSKLPQLHSTNRNPRRHEKRSADRTAHSGEHDRVLERTLAISNDPTTQRRPRQRCKRRNGKHGSGANADVLNGRDACAEGGRESDAGAGTDTEESGEQDEGCVARGREPEAEDEDGGECTHDNHHIKAAYFVGKRIGDSTA